jgi:hypothetical protein
MPGSSRNPNDALSLRRSYIAAPDTTRPPRQIIQLAPLTGPTLTEAFTFANGSGPPTGWTAHTYGSASQNVQSNKWQQNGLNPYIGTSLTYTAKTYTDIDVTVQLELEASPLEAYPGLGIRMHNSDDGWYGPNAEPQDGYMGWYDINLNQVVANTVIGGGYSGGGNASFTFSGSGPYMIRAQAIGSQIKFKFWLASAGEPGAWTIEWTDTSSTVGFFGVREQALFTSSKAIWDNFSWTDLVPPSGTNYTDSVQTDIVSVTSETDVATLFDSPLVTVVGVTSEIDVATLFDSPLTTVVGVTSESDSLGTFEGLQTTVAALTGETDLLSMYEVVQSTIVGITSAPEQLDLFESVQTTAVGITSEADRADFNDQTSDIIVAETSETDSLGSTSTNYSDDVQTDVTAVTSVVDVLAMTELPSTVVASITSVADQAGFMETPITVITVLTGEVDLLQLFESLQVLVTGVTSEIEQLSLFEAVQAIMVGTTSEADQATLNDSPTTVIVAETSEVDTLNGEPPPSGPSRQYFGSILLKI